MSKMQMHKDSKTWNSEGTAKVQVQRMWVVIIQRVKSMDIVWRKGRKR
jgi:hypothetical protein